MRLTLEDALITADVLDDRLASARPNERAQLEQKLAMVNFAAFGLFKEADIGQMLGQYSKPLAWGIGLGLPALGVGHALISDAHHQGDKMVANARNQALLTALGVGGLKSVGELGKHFLGAGSSAGGYPPSLEGQQNNFKFSSDYSEIRKLAALLLLDDVLEQQVAQAEPHEKHAVLECLLINRTQGSALLRKLRL